MQREKIEFIIIEQAALAADRSKDMITIESTIDDLAMDSLAVISLVVGVEDALNIEISCTERISMGNLSDMRDVIENKIAQDMPVAA